jgi:hypothetical protein
MNIGFSREPQLESMSGTQHYGPKIFFMAPGKENWRLSWHSGPKPFSACQMFRRNEPGGAALPTLNHPVSQNSLVHGRSSVHGSVTQARALAGAICATPFRSVNEKRVPPPGLAAFALAGNATTIIPETDPNVPPPCGTPGQPNCDPPIDPALPAPPPVALIVAANDRVDRQRLFHK